MGPTLRDRATRSVVVFDDDSEDGSEERPAAAAKSGPSESTDFLFATLFLDVTGNAHRVLAEEIHYTAPLFSQATMISFNLTRQTSVHSLGRA